MGMFDAVLGKETLRDTVNSAIKYKSSSRTLNDNRDTILKAVKKYEHLVKQGKFGVAEKTNVLSQVKKSVDLNSQETADLKKVLTHISEKKPTARVRINRADDESNYQNPHFAGQTQLANKSGLSGIASPGITHTNYRPVASISQVMKAKDKSGSANVVSKNLKGNASSRRPLIPLSR
ncbi:hypothetical protein CVU83_02625 [Candidatus Falkowbacteria bacterium HGW-Falkowbacteria-2]|uniref:Uncharacterized protein n=1 Tax=Candidatus Falkowbacteria bacterium HGW-Falkowbacteria-2 TaxID=2013769 RepID=A0A2N2DZ52_9BACT|nr:MAG: hypothetical protein CVU83_02625 [Candidatus Falkowbacteria bacterium HGW-Falkowbacteria-2]